MDAASRQAAPFLKWAGGKRRLLDRIVPNVPELRSTTTYYEPFVGGGALFFRLRPRRAVLGDSNLELIDTYAAVRDSLPRVLEQLKRLEYSEDAYYRIRDWSPRTSERRAARFIYLNKTCFNGLYRVNKVGRFNVPFGRNGPNLLVSDEEQLVNASDALARARLVCSDFEETVASARRGSVVYFDPPYTTAHTNNGFVEYNALVFSWKDQRRLAAVAASLVQRGVFVLVSNADHPAILRLYRGQGLFRCVRLPRSSTIAAATDHRFATSEVLLVGGISK